MGQSGLLVEVHLLLWWGWGDVLTHMMWDLRIMPNVVGRDDKHLFNASNIILINIYLLQVDASISPLQVIRSIDPFDQLNSK